MARLYMADKGRAMAEEIKRHAKVDQEVVLGKV
jgi:hypothetical protein